MTCNTPDRIIRRRESALGSAGRETCRQYPALRYTLALPVKGEAVRRGAGGALPCPPGRLAGSASSYHKTFNFSKSSRDLKRQKKTKNILGTEYSSIGTCQPNPALLGYHRRGCCIPYSTTYSQKDRDHTARSCCSERARSMIRRHAADRSP